MASTPTTTRTAATKIRAGLIIAALLCLSACGDRPAPAGTAPAAETPAPATPQPLPAPSSPHWLLRPNTRDPYQISRGPGLCREDGWIDLTGPLVTNPLEINPYHVLAYNSAGGPSIALVMKRQVELVTAVPDRLEGTLLERFDPDMTYIGESGNNLVQDITPPEPMIPLNPTVGQVIRKDCVCNGWDGKTGVMVVECRVHAVGVQYDGLPDCVITSTVEHPQNPMGGRSVYFNVFSGGKLALQIHGTPRADGTVDVIHARLTG